MSNKTELDLNRGSGKSPSPHSDKQAGIRDLFRGSLAKFSVMVLIIAAALSAVAPSLYNVWIGIAVFVLALMLVGRREPGFRVGCYFGMGIGILFAAAGLWAFIFGSTRELALNGLLVSFSMLFVIVGGYMAIVVPVKTKYRKKRCVQTVSAVIIDHKRFESTDEDGHTTVSYAPVFEYEFNNVPYRAVSPGRIGAVPQHGINQKIFINPGNPTEIYDPKLESAGESVVMVIFGTFFVLGGFVALFSSMSGF